MKRLIFISLLCFTIGWGANVAHADPLVLGFPPEKLNALIATEAATESYAVINTLLDFPISFGQWNGSYNASSWSMNFIGTGGGRTLNISLNGTYIPAGGSNPFPTISWVGVYT